MSIKARLILLAAVAFISIVLVSILSLWSSEKQKEIIHHTNQIVELSEAASFHNQIQSINMQYLLTLQHDPSNPDIVKMHDHPTSMHWDKMQDLIEETKTQLSEFKGHESAEEFTSDVKAFEERLLKYFQDIEEGIRFYSKGEFTHANHHYLTVINPDSVQTLQKIDQFRAHLREVSHEAQAEAEAFAGFQENLMLGSGLFFLVLIVAISWTLIQSIRKGIHSTVQEVNQVVDTMNFNQKLSDRSDELGEISKALNLMLMAIKTSISETNTVVSAIANGDFTKRVNSQQKGDLDILKQGVNGSAESVDFMMSELSKVMQALYQGQFDIQMDPRVPKSFSQQVDDALNSINTVMVEIINVMSAMNKGQFDQRVQVEARGDLAELKERVNSSMDSLSQAISDIKRIVVAQSEGDLTQSITQSYEGELAVLKDAINKSIASLDEIVFVAMEAAGTVATAADEVAAGSMDLSQRVQEQAASIEQSSATMEEFSSSVQNNAQSASEETNIEHEVESKAKAASEVMSQTIVAMNAIQESSHKISEIVSMIDGIAFQTNLLALNAAVEAARAGEHGRGFAVVAGEVRALAQKSAEAAKDISSLINESVNRIDQGTKLATESGEVINQITDSIEQVTRMSEQISGASNEQAQGVQQLQIAIGQIDQVTQQNAALVEETSAAAESMRDQATVLKEKMSFFRTTKLSSQLPPVSAKPVQSEVKSIAAPAAKKEEPIQIQSKDGKGKGQSNYGSGEDWVDF
ncbi:methyl-accepting chemotaxis protein [Thiomicrorhabdus xiamenensis]|uniref:HAMP domain-containing protein n=1 Tax=Thiomicrorhabdus xiamenensis TaxID=2739063 RepID=A0A7D4TAY7_9GAMM|nr:methyl-accepting chemotaxis protein [Thiomicrorhabdus xiamenensis]QKI89426.1 HAMP domain-containing protein [Thiomicrorhabdus xiamenensis]